MKQRSQAQIEELRKAVQESERLMKGIIESIGHLLTDRDRRQAIEFFDVGEYGLCFETIVFSLIEQRRTITAEMFEELQGAFQHFFRRLTAVDEGMMSKLRDSIRS